MGQAGLQDSTGFKCAKLGTFGWNALGGGSRSVPSFARSSRGFWPRQAESLISNPKTLVSNIDTCPGPLLERRD